MALPPVDNAFYPTPDETLAIALTNVKYAYDAAGIVVNVTDGSELYKRFKVLADLVSIAINNNQLALADVSPLDAAGDALVELAGTYGIEKRPASSAVGTVLVGVSSGTVTIPAGFVGTSPAGIQVKTTSAFTVADGEGVTVQAMSAGANTDIEEDETITWDSAAIGKLNQVATVGSGGITGGADADTEEVLRQRFLRRLRDPGVGGNAAYVADNAENASAAIERCFVHMAARGPSSYDAAIVRQAGDRVLSAAVVNAAAVNILGLMPGSADLNMTSVLVQYVDVVIDLTVPLPVNAGGAGGGWRDAVPWPSTSETGGSVYARVTAIPPVAGSYDKFRVNSTNTDPPVVGKRFGIWNPTTEEMVEYTIAAVGGGTGAYEITIDSQTGSSLSWLTVGMHCSASAINLTQYASEFAAAMRTLGPGEKTSNIDKLPRALRYPSPDLEYSQSITSLQLAAVINAHPEVLNMTYAGRFDTGAYTTRTSPSVANIETDPPNILVLKNLSFRRQV